MQLYTLVLEYAGGTYLEQVGAADATDAIGIWITKASGTPPEIADLFARGDPPVAIAGLTNVWCASVTGTEGLALLNIIATSA